MDSWRLAGLAAVLAAAVTAVSAQPGAGDTFSTSTDAADAGASTQGGDAFSTTTGPPASEQAFNCFDRAWRQARNALHAWQITDIPNWRNPGCAPAAGSGGDELAPCWGPLRSAQSILEQAAELFETARRTPSPEAESITAQANGLVKQAAALLDQAQNCYRPLFAARHKPRGSSPPSPQQQAQQPLAPPQDQNQPPAGTRPQTGKAETTCYALPDQNGRFGIANINEADPALLVTARILQGWDDCAKQNAIPSLLMFPVTYLTDKLRFLRTVMAIYGYSSTAAELIQDIDAIRQPGQSLGDASYHVGRLLCQGQTLKDILARAKLNRPKHDGDGSPPGQAVGASERDSTISSARNPPAKPSRLGLKVPPPEGPPNGITALDDGLLRRFVTRNPMILVLRDSNPWALRWIDYPGAVAKPMALKAKSLKPPDDLSALTAAQQAEEANYAPYYGLASARGLSQAERDQIVKAGYLIRGKCNGEIITTRSGGYIYSDVDLHGAYDMKGNWIASNPLLKSLNNTTTGRFFQHGAQDDFHGRNDRSSASFGPQPPVTVYYPGGVVHLTTMQQMKDFYLQHGIDWNAIYPLPLSQYQVGSGKP